ncbi:MAG: siphovirus Gp157 family protein [Alphaproteobacteria bacterium]|nr:siphovirus Gp157 family protein [Alphaproteobacteria bacterium]
MSNLVISQKAIQLASNLELLEGEITPDVEQQMLDLSKSADDAGLFLDRSEYLIKYFKSFRDQISAKIKTLENASEFVESELKKSVETLGELSGESFVFKLQKTKGRVVVDESLLHENYLRTKITHEPDKAKIYDDLKAGIQVEGAKLEENYSLKKTINTKKIGK